MANATDKLNAHVEHWKHNRNLIGLIPDSHPDWVVTVAFYTAVHAIDAALANEDVTVWNHETRFKAMSGINRLRKIGTLYHPLYDLCRKLRYAADPNLWVPPSQLDQQVIQRYLLPIERSVQTLIGRTLNLPPIELFKTATTTPQ